MSRKDREKREKRTIRSARDRAEKHVDGFSASSLNLPQGVSLLKLKKGAMFIDIIPYVVGKGNPFADEGEVHYERTYHVHKNVGPNGDSYVCLKKTTGKPCPICEYRAKLANDPDTDEDTIKEMAPKERQLFNVIDLKDADKGIQLMESSYHLFGRLIDEAIKEPDEEAEAEGWETFHDPENGLSLKLTVVDETFNGRTFQKVSRIDFRPRKKQYEESIIDDAYCLDDILKIKKYDELKKALLQEGDDEPDEDDAPAPKRRLNAKEEAEEEDEALDEVSTPKKKPVKKEEIEEDDEDLNEDEPEDDEDESAPVKKKPVKKAEVEDEEDPDDWDDESEEEEEKPIAKKKPKVVEEDDEDEPEEEDEEETPVKKKTVPSGKVAKKKSDDEDEWDD